MELLLKQHKISSQNDEFGSTAAMMQDVMQQANMTPVIKTEQNIEPRSVTTHCTLLFSTHECGVCSANDLNLNKAKLFPPPTLLCDPPPSGPDIQADKRRPQHAAPRT